MWSSTGWSRDWKASEYIDRASKVLLGIGLSLGFLLVAGDVQVPLKSTRCVASPENWTPFSKSFNPILSGDLIDDLRS